MRGAGFVFSTFAMRRAEYALQQTPGYSAAAAPLLARAAALVPIDDDTFRYLDPGEAPGGSARMRQLHQASYIEGVAAGLLAEARLGPCSCAAGYSMGLFAALCHLGAIDFEHGLQVMDAVCAAVHDGHGEDCAIGAVEGLTPAHLRAVIASAAPAVEIIDRYGAVTLVTCGRTPDVQALLTAAGQAGAVYTRLIPTTAAYHTASLQRVEGRLRDAVDAIEVRPPRAVLISATTQQPLATATAIREELVRNVTHPLDWLATTQALVASGITRLCECGSSQSLGAMAVREVPGSYEVTSLLSPAVAAPR